MAADHILQEPAGHIHLDSADHIPKVVDHNHLVVDTVLQHSLAEVDPVHHAVHTLRTDLRTPHLVPGYTQHLGYHTLPGLGYIHHIDWWLVQRN